MPTTKQHSGLANDVERWFEDRAARRDPYDLYARLRREDPVHYCEAAATWVVTRYADINRVLRSQNATRAPWVGTNSKDYLYDADGSLRPVHKVGTIRYLEGATHARVRLLVGQALKPNNVALWQQDLDFEVERAVARVREMGQMDLMADFAYELPLRMICRILGIPDSDVYSYRDWTKDLLIGQSFNASDEVKARGDAAALAFIDHLTELLAFYRKNDANGLLPAMLAASEDGETLSDEEIISVAGGVIAAGHETSTALIGNMTLALLRNPDELARLRADESLMPLAVEEGLRYEGPPVWVPRFALDGLSVDGIEIEPGTQVALFLASANRDEEVFEDPNAFRIRERDKGHLGFVAGNRFCLGANLARAEARAAMTAVINEFPNLELTADEVDYIAFPQVRQLAALPVRWDPTGGAA